LLADTHCHLNFNSFDPDRPSVLERAREAGVLRILNPGIDLPSSNAAVKLAGDCPEVFAAIGVHPNDALTWSDSTAAELRQLCLQEKVAAIGEIGLDYYWQKSPADLQKEILRAQLCVAAETGLPVVIHIRDATREDRQAMVDCLDILEEWQAGLSKQMNPLANNPGVLHSFSGNLEDARRAIAMNYYIGVTGPVTFPKSQVMQEVVREVKEDRLLIETDAPFLTPEPFRGKRNEPAYVKFVAEKIAAIKGYTYDHVCDLTTENAGRLFHW
jgi:TatD DNase family protein